MYDPAPIIFVFLPCRSSPSFQTRRKLERRSRKMPRSSPNHSRYPPCAILSAALLPSPPLQSQSQSQSQSQAQSQSQSQSQSEWRHHPKPHALCGQSHCPPLTRPPSCSRDSSAACPPASSLPASPRAGDERVGGDGPQGRAGGRRAGEVHAVQQQQRHCLHSDSRHGSHCKGEEEAAGERGEKEAAGGVQRDMDAGEYREAWRQHGFGERGWESTVSEMVPTML